MTRFFAWAWSLIRSTLGPKPDGGAPMIDIVALMNDVATLLGDLAERTTSKVDDTIVAAVKLILAMPELQQLVRDIVSHQVVQSARGEPRTAQIKQLVEQASPELKARVTQLGIDWLAFVEAMPTIIRWALKLLQLR